MRCIVAGSRDLKVSAFDVKELLISFMDILGEHFSLIISGEAKSGADSVAKEAAQELGIDFKPYPVTKEDWDKYGKPTGPMRNRKMAENADCLLLIWDGVSPGSTNMKEEAEKLGLAIMEIKFSK